MNKTRVWRRANLRSGIVSSQAPPKMWRPLAFLAILALAAGGCSHPAPPSVAASQTSAGITATLTTEAPSHTGDDTLVVTLHDAKSAQPIGDANVTGTAQAQSPRLPGQAVTGRAQGNGVYDIPVTLPIVSSYKVVVTAERPGHATATFAFPVDVPN